MLNGITALFVQHELGGGSALAERNAAYLQHAATPGEHPRLARLLSQGPAPAGPGNGCRRIVTRDSRRPARRHGLTPDGGKPFAARARPLVGMGRATLPFGQGSAPLLKVAWSKRGDA